MMNREEKLQQILSDESVIDQLISAKSISDTKDIFLKNGLDLSEEEVRTVLMAIAQTSEDREFNEQELENVVGGTLIELWWVVKKAYPIVKFLGPKLYKLGEKYAEWLG